MDEENFTGIEGATPTPKKRRVARDVGLAASLSSGHYPEFLGMHGPSQDLNQKESSPFDFLSLLCFVTNVFPERMDTPVARLQPEDVLRYQPVPPLLPAYNKFMGGVDRTDHLRKTYGFDRKSKHYWLRLFFQFFDYAVNNAYLLYKHGCIARNICPKDMLGFRLELVHVLLKIVGSKSGSTVQKKIRCNA